MIPVLVVPAYSRPDLVDRVLASVDVPVDRLVVVDNSPTGLGRDFADAKLVRPPFGSMGYTGSINFVVSQTPSAPWWAWASNDVVFGPGDLAKIADLMAAADGPRLITYGFTWGAFNAACIERVGLFDEWSFWPIYFDDNDYLVRCVLGDVDWILYEGGIEHGADGHAHSVTVKTDPDAAAANAVSWNLNRDAYVAKWGGEPGQEKFRTPWGRDVPLWATKPDPAGRASRAWS